MPALILQIINILGLTSSVLGASVNAAPQLTKLYEQARGLFDMMFRGGLITVEQQNALRSWADAHEEAVLAGNIPPEWQVEPDPE